MEFGSEDFDCFDGITQEISTVFSPRYFNGKLSRQTGRKREIRRYYLHEDVEGDDTEKESEIDTSDVEINDDESIGNGGLEKACKETGQVDKKKNTMALKKRRVWGLSSDD